MSNTRPLRAPRVFRSAIKISFFDDSTCTDSVDGDLGKWLVLAGGTAFYQYIDKQCKPVAGDERAINAEICHHVMTKQSMNFSRAASISGTIIRLIPARMKRKSGGWRVANPSAGHIACAKFSKRPKGGLSRFIFAQKHTAFYGAIFCAVAGLCYLLLGR